MRPIGSVGRAERFAERAEEDARASHELWRFARDDAGVAARLVELGARGVGGFVAWWEDADGAWARRRVGARDALAAGALPWREAMAVVRDVAKALEACERASLSPGRLHPASIAIGPPASIAADALVHAMVGAPPASGVPMGRWVPPEQAGGADWDAAANRYALGLVAYRMIAGEHPFEGAGLRHAIAGQAMGAPPFAAPVAARVRPGVQALVLAMLDPDPRARPRDARAIARRCDELLAPPGPTRPRAGGPSAAPPARRRGRAGVRVSRGTTTRVAIGVALLAGVAAIAVAATEPEVARVPALAPARTLTEARASSCAPCHAREVAEWGRSVMAHSAKSPLFGALESVVEEQVGKDDQCPNGAGILRGLGTDACRSQATGRAVTASGGEGWCVHCHAPVDTLRASAPAWSARRGAASRAPLRDVLAPESEDGIACAACHEAIGPVASHARASLGKYEGNATWTSFATGRVFAFRPEDARGLTGIANSGYALDPGAFFGGPAATPHRAPSEPSRAYLRSSELCGACHDVRLFGTDVIGVARRGEHFKRLRNAYSEWRAWSEDEARRGRVAPTCQGCHMSLYPGVCASGGDGGGGCAPGTHFEARAAGELPLARVAPTSAQATRVAIHGFASVDVPLARELPDALVDDPARDAFDLPLGVRARRDLLLSRALRLAIDPARRRGSELEVPVVVENVGAGHRVPAGFSQEREVWVELAITDADGRLVYRVGHLDEPDEDLRDKVFVRVNVDDDRRDARGRPLGVFGADVTDGPDVPRWSPPPGSGATHFRGRGLLNLQNGFFRCVRCIGVIDARGECLPAPGVAEQGITRADRFDDGDYDADTGACRSNLDGARALLETYFPIGALDAARGIAKGPDAILDTRSAPPGVPLTYAYVIDARGARAPFHVEARLLFRAFPPYLVRAFAAYEARMAARGLRPSGPQVDVPMLRRIDVVELARAEARIE